MSPYPYQPGILLLLLAASAGAQFTELAATDDGSRLFFTSRLLLKGAPAASLSEMRLYQLNANGVQLFAERGALAPQSSGTSSDGVRALSISGDGAVVGFTLGGICKPGTDCAEIIDRIEVRGREAPW